MKKLLAVLLAFAMLLSLTACGAKDEPETTTDATLGDTTVENTTEGDAPVQDGLTGLTVLENIWGAYADEEKFPIFGGNMEAGIMDAPGEYDLAYAENMTYNLLIKEAYIPYISQAASMIHAMNANTFTGAAFTLKENVDLETFAENMQIAVQGNEWMCGFPERLVIASVGENIVIVAFGVGDMMTPFYTHLTESYPQAEILFDEPIA